ncbi:MAG: polyprenyl synthetase family protein, partial [Mariprofundaceae bacterium]|nr:polyprenyl synthetase family protein [Mariprofundaceae bacterium]
KVMAERQQVVEPRLWDAMSYALLAGGKRVRPGLLLACFKACGGKRESMAMPAAISIECMHTYSLIHDDLPCMDDDDLRRGNPTCHKKFDEATAVLAADALQTLAFELLSDLDVAVDIRLTLVRKLAIASGAQGMVGGQMMDMRAEVGGVSSILEVERIHLHKTGALIRYSCEAGALLAGANEKELHACSRYGEAVGLLFQIADDILDATATSADLGKSAGKDKAQNKATYVSIEGLQRARELAENLRAIAGEACNDLNDQGEHLQTLANYILERGQ